MLASILPGLRETRTPLVVGALWVAGFLLLFKSKIDDFKGSPIHAYGQGILDLFPNYVDIAALAIATYLIGVLSQASLGSAWSRFIEYYTHKQFNFSKPPNFFQKTLFNRARPNERVTATLRSTIIERIPSKMAPVANLTSVELLESQFELASLSLAKNSLDQFQQYDRLRSEADFRCGVALPMTASLIAFGTWCPVSIAIPIALGALIVGAAIAIIGSNMHQRADELLASAIYFGYASLPILDNLSKSSTEYVGTREHIDESEAIAWFLDYMAARSSLTDNDYELTSKLRHPGFRDSEPLKKALTMVKPSTLRRFSHITGYKDDERPVEPSLDSDAVSPSTVDSATHLRHPNQSHDAIEDDR